MNKYQVMDDLTLEEYEALKESIREKGILSPVEVDQDGNTIDGHNRIQIAEELKAEGFDIDIPKNSKTYGSEEEKREAAYIMNMQRRQVNKDTRKKAARNILKEFPSKSNRQIAGIVGMNHETIEAIRKELIASGEIRHQEKTVGKNGIAQAVKTTINAAGVYGISVSKTGEGISKIMVKSHELADRLRVSRHILGGLPTTLAKQLQLEIAAMGMDETIESHNKATEYIKNQFAEYAKGEIAVAEVFEERKEKVADTVENKIEKAAEEIKAKVGRPPKPEPEIPKEQKEQLQRLEQAGAELYEEKPAYVENLDTVLTADLHDTMKSIAFNLKTPEDAKKAYKLLESHMQTVVYVQQILIGKGGV